MIYRCNTCEKEINLMKDAKYCPICGNHIEPINLEERIAALYDAGKNLREISSELRTTEIVVGQVLAKAALDGMIGTDGLIQTEYEAAITAAMNDNWDGKLKTLKNTLPSECSYVTLNYYARKNRRMNAEARTNRIRDMVKAGTPIMEIAEKTRVFVRTIERIMVEEIAKDKAVANAYINNDYKAQILEMVNAPDWNGKLRSIKEALPEEVTYTNIKATIAKNQ